MPRDRQIAAKDPLLLAALDQRHEQRHDWLVTAVPIFFAARWGVARYRATIGAKVQQSRLYKAITASKAYNVYRLFRPE